MTDGSKLLEEMNDRSREVFRRVVEGYLESGEPVGSRTLSRTLSEKVSAATIRNVMQDLEFLGLLGSPHVSAGRVPTERGLRMFVDGLLEVSELGGDDRKMIDATLKQSGGDVGAMMDNVGSALSGITRGASLVLGRTLTELASLISREITARRQELDVLARDLVENGLAFWEDEGGPYERLLVRGRANLLAEGADAEDLERIRTLFDDLERKRDIAEFLELAEAGEGVRIFIGSENKLFSLSGSSLVVSPYMNADRKIIGAIGVIGPTRLNYGRIVPIVDYTAQLVGRLLSDRS